MLPFSFFLRHELFIIRFGCKINNLFVEWMNGKKKKYVKFYWRTWKECWAIGQMVFEMITCRGMRTMIECVECFSLYVCINQKWSNINIIRTRCVRLKSPFGWYKFNTEWKRERRLIEWEKCVCVFAFASRKRRNVNKDVLFSFMTWHMWVHTARSAHNHAHAAANLLNKILTSRHTSLHQHNTTTPHWRDFFACEFSLFFETILWLFISRRPGRVFVNEALACVLCACNGTSNWTTR